MGCGLFCGWNCSECEDVKFGRPGGVGRGRGIWGGVAPCCARWRRHEIAVAEVGAAFLSEMVA